MKHVFVVISIAFSVLLFFCFHIVQAGSFKKPIGAKVIGTYEEPPGIECASRFGGPFIFKTVNNKASSPYISGPGAKIYNYKHLNPGSWILGFYSEITDEDTCIKNTDPPTPFPTIPLILWGSTR